MRKAARRLELIEKIREMATSGTYRSARSIEARLRLRYPEVLTVMKESFLPREIDSLCSGKSIFDQ
jgi:hypothetical protein